MVGTAAAFGATQADAALKQLYKKINFQESTYDRRPLIGLLPKDEGFYGRNMPIVNEYGRPQSVSATFSTAQSLAEASSGAAKLEDFLLTRISEHGVMTIDGDTLESMSNDVGAFVDAMRVQANGALKSLSDRLETLAPGNQTGSLGQVGTISANTITLKDVNDVHKFEVGMSIVASDTDGGALLTGSEVIAGIDRNAGTLTSTNTNWTDGITGSTLDADDFLACQGDAKANSTAKVTAGFESWLPNEVTSAAFFGVDRTADATRLGGCRSGTDASPVGGLVKTAIIDGASITSMNGGSPDHAFLHHVKYRQLCKELDSQTMYTKVVSRGVGGEAFAKVSYTGVQVLTDHGPVACVAANKLKSSVIYLLEIMTWVFASIKALVRYSSPDGLTVMRQSANDGIEGRMVHRGNIGCRLPGHNCRVVHG